MKSKPFFSEDNNLIGNFDPTVGLEQVGYNISSPLNGDHNNFSPRFGIAWDVRGNGKTVVRLGASVMYENPPVATFADLANALGLSRVPTGAKQVTCSTNPCVNGSKQVTTPGFGTIAISGVNVRRNEWAERRMASTNSVVPIQHQLRTNYSGQCWDGVLRRRFDVYTCGW